MTRILNPSSGGGGTDTVTLTGTQTLTNKTLTDPQIDNNVMCRAYKSGGNQADLANGISTQVTFASESYDLGGNFTSNAFTAPQTGFYRIKTNITFLSVVAAKLYTVGILVNDAVVSDSYSHSGLAQSLGVFCEYTASITSGHTVKVYATSYAGVDTVDIIQGSQYTWLEVEFIGI